MKQMLFVAVLLSLTTNLWAHGTYTGRSGAPGRQTCASSCHGGPIANTVEIVGFPSEYTPGQSYLLTIRKMSGGTVVNFNASCRIGETGTDNAGVIASGQNTSTYNVTGETNGVHFTTVNHDSGQFTWTAPSTGTGLVKLYAGAIQTDVDGDNSRIILSATEAVAIPSAPDSLVVIAEDAGLHLYWQPSLNATMYNVYRDTIGTVTVIPENLIGTVGTTDFLDTIEPADHASYIVTAQ
ncbi:MAG: hypothetical protein KDB65_09780 [Calditrichaeota bacterium]|nr:hypothetical protein [Calditrichota bacterium]MCB9369480.1 hypothetical protein [Calditrichota bacterium]